MSKTISGSEDLDDISMTAQELHILSELDSRQYGYLQLNQPENTKKKALVQKAVKYLQLMVIQARKQQKEQNENEPNNFQSKQISIDPKTWVKLGHFHLLLEEYGKALSAYQMFYKTQAENHWQNTSFLYGLGLVYFHFKSYQCTLLKPWYLQSVLMLIQLFLDGASMIIFELKCTIARTAVINKSDAVQF